MTLKGVFRSGLLISALLLAALLSAAMLARPTHAAQSVPYQMNFQGRLNDSTGAPMPNGTYNMKFRIYSASTGGTLLWSEQRAVSASTGVTVTTGGLFSVQLGAVTSLPSNIFNSSSPLYLEIELPTPGTATCGTASCESYTEGPMGPRNPMVSSPFAINSDLLDGLDSSAFALASGGAGYIQNQNFSVQSAANFWIGGDGRATNLTATSTLYTQTVGFTNGAGGLIGSAKYSTSGTLTIGLSNSAAGSHNIALGETALQANSSGNSNIAIGHGALDNLSTGSGNIAIGAGAMSTWPAATTGSNNVSIGYETGTNNATGSNNVFLGYHAGYIEHQGPYDDPSWKTLSNLQNSAAIGAYAQVQANNSIVLGSVGMGTKIGVGITAPANIFSISPVSINGSAAVNGLTASQSGTTVTASSPVFSAANVGETLLWADDGSTETITGYTDSTHVTVSASMTKTSISFRTHKVGFQVTNAGDVYTQNTSTTAFRVLNGAGTSLLTGDTSSMTVSIGGSLSVAAGKSITLAGGNTASRPASPTAGMMYYDTSTKQLLTYNGSKWVGSQKQAAIVAASNSSQTDKDAADYVATGSDDGATINSALTAAAGGTVYLQAGTYTLGATSISVPNNTILAGAGDGTVLTYANSLASGTYYAITNTDTSTGAGVTIRDLTIDGNKANQSAASTWGIYLNGMGSTTRSGATVENTTIKNLYNNEAIYLTNSSSNTITGNQIYSNGKALSLANSSSGNTVANNTLTGNGGNGALSTDGLSGTNTITGNTTSDSTIGMYINSSSNTITGNTANTNAMAGIYLAGGGNTVTSNTTRGNGIGIYVVAAGNTVTSNIVSSSNGDGISIYSSNNIISSNRIQDSGSGVGMDWSNGITVSGNSNQVVDNQITDTAGAGFAMSIFGTNNYLSNNTFSGTGATSINDGGTNTIYSGQMKSATGDLTFRVGADSATAFSFQNAAGTSILTADTSASQLKINASTLVTTNSTTALKIQNTSNTSLFQVDTSAMQVVVGTTTNGITFTSNGMTYTGTARPSNQVTLSAEYSGATFTGDGTNNNGTLGSDFCSGSSRLNINPMSPGTNPCAATNTYNYYQWTTSQATAQDYDIYVRYQIPSDYDAGSLSNLAITGWGTTTGEQVTIALFSDASGSACSTSSNAISAATTWQQATVASPLGSCTIAAGDTVTFRVHLQAGQGNYARSGPITFTYKKKF